MITWLQTFFLKHNKWLFSALLVVIIVTFVLTIGNQSFFGGGASVRAEAREYYGYDLNSREDLQTIGQYGAISAQLHPELGVQGERIQQYAMLRVSALGLANDLGIKGPDGDQLRSYIESLPIFHSQSGEGFDPERYTQFRGFIAASMGGEQALAKVLREDYRIDRVREAFAGPGYVVPFSIEQQYAQAETTWDVALAQRNYGDFQPELDASEETLRAYYDEDPARFAVPERLDLSVVHFEADAFLDRVEEPSEASLEQYFNRYRFRYNEQPPEGESEPIEVSLDEVRDRVVADWRREQAKQLAQNASDRFVSALYEQQIEKDSDAFRAALQEARGSIEDLPPYSRNDPPRSTGLPESAFNSMWIHATGERYYSDLLPTSGGAAVLLRQSVMPETIPPFDEVAAEVEAAWSAEERRRQFAQAAQDWEAGIKEALSNGATFEEAAENAGFTVSHPEPFLGKETPPELSRLQVASELPSLDPEEASAVSISEDTAALVYLKNAERPEVDHQSEAFTTYLESELEGRRATSGWSSLNAWTDRTLQVSAPEIAREG